MVMLTSSKVHCSVVLLELVGRADMDAARNEARMSRKVNERPTKACIVPN